MLSDPGLAPAWDPPDGRGSRDLGDQPLASGLGRAHLYIVDGRALTTGGVVNPTNTICALALRAAEHLRDYFADLRRAAKPEAS
jgi:hypothetical protein